MNAITIPAINLLDPMILLVKRIKFVVPEDLDVSGGPSNGICNSRNFRVRLIAHNIDTDYRCCDEVTVP